MHAAPPLEELAVARARVASRLEDIGRLVLVTSGKGGVGKSAVAVNLAAALAQRGQRVGLLDADLQGPSVAAMLGLRGQPLRARADGVLGAVPGPLGLAVQSMDFFLQGNQPLDWDGPRAEGAPLRGALEQAALGDLLGSTEWGALDALVVDLPPGADRLPALASLLDPGAAGPRPAPALGALFVTIPTRVSLLAVERSLRRARQAGIPLLGLVENLGSTVCGACGHEGPLFQEAGVEGLARDMALPLVSRIPFDAELAAAADAGRPFLEGPGRGSAAGRAFAELADCVCGWQPVAPGEESW